MSLIVDISLELGWPYREYIKTVKNGSFSEELLTENNFRLF